MEDGGEGDVLLTLFVADFQLFFRGILRGGGWQPSPGINILRTCFTNASAASLGLSHVFEVGRELLTHRCGYF